MIRRYSRPAALHRRLHQAPPAPGDEVERLDHHALAAPRRSAPPTRRPPSASLAGSVTSTTWYGVASSSSGSAAADLAPASPCARRGPGRCGRAPSVASRWNGASFRSVERRRPASSSAGRPSTNRADRRRARSPVAARAASSTSAPPRRGLLERGDRLRQRRLRRPRPTAAYWLAQQLLRLGRPRHQLAVEADPVGLELVPEVRRASSAARTRSRNCASSAGSSKNRRPVRV